VWDTVSSYVTHSLHGVVLVMSGYCTGMLKLELCDHVATISSLNFAPSPSVLLVSASMDGTLKLWDMSDDGNMIKTLRTNCTAFYGCRWAPDATALATVGNYHSVSIVCNSLIIISYSLPSHCWMFLFMFRLGTVGRVVPLMHDICANYATGEGLTYTICMFFKIC